MYLEKMLRSKCWTFKYSKSRIGQKHEHMLEPFPKDIEEILISDKYNENECNDEEGDSENVGNTF